MPRKSYVVFMRLNTVLMQQLVFFILRIVLHGQHIVGLGLTIDLLISFKFNILLSHAAFLFHNIKTASYANSISTFHVCLLSSHLQFHCIAENLNSMHIYLEKQSH